MLFDLVHRAAVTSPTLYSEIMLPSSDAKCEMLPYVESSTWNQIPTGIVMTGFDVCIYIFIKHCGCDTL